MKTTTGTSRDHACFVDGCSRQAVRYHKRKHPICGMHDQRYRNTGSFDLLPRAKPVYEQCKVEGCEADATRVSHQLCEKHHARRRRTGTTDYTELTDGKPIHHSSGYILLYAPDHPLRVGVSPRVREHRVVYYDANGPGPFDCYHCGKEVGWDGMHIDHLDDNTKNNDISNLVASCPVCNQARGRHKMVKTRRARGRVYEHEGVTMCVSEWALELGISRAAFMYRIEHWEREDVFTKPRGNAGPR